MTKLNDAIRLSAGSPLDPATRDELDVALAYARKHITLKGVAQSLGIRETQAYNRVARLVLTAVKMGWLSEDRRTAAQKSLEVGGKKA